MSARRVPERDRRQAIWSSVMAISMLTLSLVTVLAPAAIAQSVMVAQTSQESLTPSLSVSLTGITPEVAAPKASIRIDARVTNSSRVDLTSPVARVLIDQSPLTSRQAVASWATARGEPPLDEVARKSLGKTLAHGAVAMFTLIIPADAIGHLDRPFAVLPLSIEVVARTPAATQASGGVKTYLPTLGAVKAFVPLSIAWLVPLTLDPNPALVGKTSPARTAAWTKAIGPGSRLNKLIQGTQDANVTWAIDPAILGPNQTRLPGGASLAQPTPSSASTPPPTPEAAVSDPVTGLSTALAQRLKAARPGHTLWALPYADQDLAALLALGSANHRLAALIGHRSTLAVTVGPARSDIAWPVTGTLTPRAQAQLRNAFASTGLAAAVTSASTLDNHDSPTADASSKASSGLPLLAFDESLSRTLAQTSSKTDGALTIQRFLADSMALLGERPGTPNRSVLVAEPRTFAGDPRVLRSLFAAVAKSPWLVSVSTGQLLAASKKLAPEPSPGRSGSVTTSSAPTAEPSAADPMNPGTSPLSSNRLATMPGTLSTISGVASILGDGRLFASTWTDAQVQELSARWRGHPDGLAVIDAATHSAIATVNKGVIVAPSSVNFFADRGVMQVTVENELDVPIHDVQLTLTPTQPRLRIELQPGPLKIGPKSRANVHVEVTSIAAGLVEIDALLTTHNGTPLGLGSKVNVRVQPPATSLYWVLGGLAGIILVLGTQRSLRRGSTRASRPDAQEPAIND